MLAFGPWGVAQYASHSGRELNSPAPGGCSRDDRYTAPSGRACPRAATTSEGTDASRACTLCSACFALSRSAGLWIWACPAPRQMHSSAPRAEMMNATCRP